MLPRSEAGSGGIGAGEDDPPQTLVWSREDKMDVEKRDKFLKFRVTRVERYLTRAVAAADGKTMTSLFRDYVADRAAELFGSAFRQDASRQAEEQRAIGDRREPTL